MILPALLSLPMCVGGPAPVTPAGSALAPATALQDLKQEYERRRAEAEGDVQKLWTLVDWCEANSLSKERRSCLRAILKVDENDKKAHELLGHVYYDGQWFTSEKKLAEYKKKEEQRIAKEKGLVRYKDGWAHPDDIPFLEKGMVKGPDGKWMDPEELKRIEEGWVQQDLTWIPPEEFEQMEKGLWKCGETWLPLEEANAYHAKLGTWWTIPGNYFVVYTTLDREWAMEALTELDRTYRDLARIYGIRPDGPLRVLVLNSGEQYNQFAGGGDEWGPGDYLGRSSVHGAYFADGWFDVRKGSWLGAGVAYWDSSTDAGTSFGRLFARHAAGLSYGHAVDPSVKTLEKFAKNPSADFDAEGYWQEKQVPEWFRYGAASYVERYFVDSFVASDGDAHWARKWAISNILRQGGLEPFDEIFAMEVSPDKESSSNLISCAGLLVTFMLDGECQPLIEQHQAVKTALKSGKDVAKEFKALEKLIVKHEDDLRMWGNL